MPTPSEMSATRYFVRTLSTSLSGQFGLQLSRRSFSSLLPVRAKKAKEPSAAAPKPASAYEAVRLFRMPLPASAFESR